MGVRRRLATLLALVMIMSSLPLVDMPVYAEEEVLLEEDLKDEALTDEVLKAEGDELIAEEAIGSSAVAAEALEAEEVILEDNDLSDTEPSNIPDGKGIEVPDTDAGYKVSVWRRGDAGSYTFIAGDGLNPVAGSDSKFTVSGNNGFEFTITSNNGSFDKYQPYATLVSAILKPDTITDTSATYKVTNEMLSKASDIFGDKTLIVGRADCSIMLMSAYFESAVFRAYDGKNLTNGPADVSANNEQQFGFLSGNRLAIVGLGGKGSVSSDTNIVRVKTKGMLSTSIETYYGDCWYNADYELFDLGTLSEDTIVSIDAKALKTSAITAKGAADDYKVNCNVINSKDGCVKISREYNKAKVKFSVKGTGSTEYRIASKAATMKVGEAEAQNITLSYDDSDGLYYYEIPFDTLAGEAYADTPSIAFTLDVEVDPEFVQHQIFVQNGAEALINGKQVFSAREGETVEIKYSGDTGKIRFDKWEITGAVADSPAEPETKFLMGSMPVQVRYSVSVAEDSRKEKLPEDADTTTRVNKVSFTNKNLKLSAGKAEKNPATVVFGAGTPPTVQYITGNADIVAVSPDGEFIAIAPGKTVVTAYCGNKKATCNVTVYSCTKDIAILQSDGSDVTGKTITLKGGEQTALNVSFFPADTSDSKKISWRSSNKNVTVKNGLVTVKDVKEVQEATIFVNVNHTNPDTGKVKSLEKSITIRTEPVKVDANKSDASKHHKLALKKKSLKLATTKEKSKYDLDVTLTPQKGASLDKCVLSVKSSNPAIVSVNKVDAITLDKEGKGVSTISMEAQGPGTAYIVVESTDPDDINRINRVKCKVTVTSPVESVKVTGDSMGLLKTEGDKKTITIREGMYDDLFAVIEPELTTDASKGLKWTASGGVSVKYGMLYAKKKTDKGKVTVKCGKQKEVITIKVE